MSVPEEAVAASMPPGIVFKPRQFALLLAGNFTFFLSFSLYFLLPRYVVQLGGSEDDVGRVMAIAGLAAIPVTPLTGAFMDRWGRRVFLISGLCIMAVANIGFILVEHTGLLLYTLRLLQGAGFALCFTSAGTMAADMLDPSRRTWGFGLFGVTTLITHAIGPSVSEYISNRIGFTPLFWVGGVLPLVALAAALRVNDADHVTFARQAARDGTSTVPSYYWVLRHTGIFFPMLLNLACGAGFGAVIMFLPTYTDALHLPAVKPFFIAYSLVAVAVRLLTGGLPDRLGKQWFIFPCIAGYFGCVYSLAHLSSTLYLTLVGACFGLSHGILYPVLNALVVDRAEQSGAMGRAMSLYIVAFNVGATTSGFAFGEVAEAHGYPYMYTIASLIVAAGVILYATSEARRRFVPKAA